MIFLCVCTLEQTISLSTVKTFEYFVMLSSAVFLTSNTSWQSPGKKALDRVSLSEREGCWLSLCHQLTGSFLLTSLYVLSPGCFSHNTTSKSNLLHQPFQPFQNFQMKFGKSNVSWCMSKYSKYYNYYLFLCSKTLSDIQHIQLLICGYYWKQVTDLYHVYSYINFCL